MAICGTPASQSIEKLASASEEASYRPVIHVTGETPVLRWLRGMAVPGFGNAR